MGSWNIAWILGIKEIQMKSGSSAKTGSLAMRYVPQYCEMVTAGKTEERNSLYYLCSFSLNL